jgi:hypothetical protein
MATEDSSKLTVTFSRETDLALRAFLGNRGMRKGDLSKFIEEAVRWRMLTESIESAREGFADLSADELQGLIDEAVTSVRTEMWPAPAKVGAAQ